MPLTAFKLLLRPGQAIPELGAGSSPAAQMIVSAILSSLWPAAAVVAGNVLAGFAGHEEPDVAVRRAVVGLLCAVGSACVSAPALALAVLRVTRDYGEHIDAKRACGAAVRLVLPMWACGVVAALPPLGWRSQCPWGFSRFAALCRRDSKCAGVGVCRSSLCFPWLPGS
ncbi:MAG: hypothetical protein MUC50_03385 [Myxococcota bacterium]|nr:hypothetical protein [Myxococcota bacterium]